MEKCYVGELCLSNSGPTIATKFYNESSFVYRKIYSDIQLLSSTTVSGLIFPADIDQEVVKQDIQLRTYRTDSAYTIYTGNITV